jgi:hypothetical protein
VARRFARGASCGFTWSTQRRHRIGRWADAAQPLEGHELCAIGADTLRQADYGRSQAAAGALRRPAVVDQFAEVVRRASRPASGVKLTVYGLRTT